ncbi:MAG: SDR family NAD(P)-dependent oxidoreductase [Acidobacteriaceae bacterium]|nr:SDR family NAD(P)-dependent oxidoreductase [Acidobacteriaceae bacterium]
MPRDIVAITGASSGIGKEFASRLAPTHDLILIARREERLRALAGEFERAYNTGTEVLVADLSAQDDLDRAAARIENEPRLVLLVNNAGFGTRGRFWEAPLESQQKMHRLHVMATLELTHAALRNMVPRDRGGIINVSSVSAYVRVPGTVSYAATKTWMNTLTEGVYLELRAMRSQVILQALCPGYTYSEFHDRLGVDREELDRRPGFWMTADEVVEASLEGLRRRKLFVIPGWRYRLLAAFLSKLPSGLRLQAEAIGGKLRSGQYEVPSETPKQVKAPE